MQTACIFAAEVAIKESERFNGIPALSVPVAEPIRHAEALIQQALTLKRSDETRTVQQDTQPVKDVKTELKQALLSGISFAVPLIVAGGMVLAVAVLLSQIFGLQDLFNEEKLLVVDVPQAGRRDARDFDGTGARSPIPPIHWLINRR